MIAIVVCHFHICVSLIDLIRNRIYGPARYVQKACQHAIVSHSHPSRHCFGLAGGSPSPYPGWNLLEIRKMRRAIVNWTKTTTAIITYIFCNLEAYSQAFQARVMSLSFE